MIPSALRANRIFVPLTRYGMEGFTASAGLLFPDRKKIGAPIARMEIGISAMTACLRFNFFILSVRSGF